MCFFVQTNHTRKELLFLMFKEINLRNHSSLHKLFYSLVLLGLSRKSINNLIACEIAIMTVSMRTYKLIDLEICICVMLSLYFTEQLQIWINRSIKGTTGGEQKKYISDIEKKILSGYGLAGIAIFIAITLLEHGL